MTAQSYLAATEPAIRHLFDGLDLYDSIDLPSIMDYVDDTGLVRMSKDESEAFTHSYEDFLALDFARATLAGSILQVAYLALKLHSTFNKLTTTAKAYGVANGSPLIKFCAGRQVHQIPIGLLIYAGRVQYNHWEAGEPTGKVAKAVLRHLYLAYSSDLNFDMAYDLTYPAPRPVSHYIVRLELGWRIYDDYLRDMTAMLLGRGCSPLRIFRSGRKS